MIGSRLVPLLIASGHHVAGMTRSAEKASVLREGTRNLLDAARAAGAERFVAQSIAWTPPGDGGASVAGLERMVLEASGVIVRYGQFYGPGTYFGDEPPSPPCVHVDDAARRTLPTLAMASTVLTFVEE